MENTTPPTPQQQPPIPPVSAQASTTSLSSTQASSRPRTSPRIGVMISFLGILLLCISLALPWFTQGDCPLPGSGNCDVPGWGILITPFIFIVDGLLNSSKNGSLAAMDIGLFLLPFIAPLIYVILVMVVALARTQKPLKNRWYWGVLFATGFCLVGLFLLDVAVSSENYNLLVGYWLVVGGLLVSSIGSIWQIRLASRI